MKLILEYGPFIAEIRLTWLRDRPVCLANIILSVSVG